jgi:DNA-binding transcriptional regulator YiaG
MKFKKQLRRWRGKQSQPEAAAALGVNLATYRNWEQGRNEPKGFGLAKMLEIIQARGPAC